jgi:predicted nucleic acid-binding protein
MIDSNVLISAVYNPDSKPARAVRNVCENHELILCDYIVAECYDVVGRKFPEHTPVLDKLLTSLGYSLVVAPRGGGVTISDPKDAPILGAAITENVDVVISGDSHFLNLDIEHPKILTPAQYIEIAEAETLNTATQIGQSDPADIFRER